MTELIDTVELAPHQTVDLRAGGEVWIHDNATCQDIKLEAGPATRLFDFLLLHQERLNRHARLGDAPQSPESPHYHVFGDDL